MAETSETARPLYPVTRAVAMDDTKARTARCACGQLRIVCEGAPEKVSACHCLECRRRTGSAFGIAAFYDRKRTLASGTSHVCERGSDSGFSIAHHFCPICGSTVFWYPARKPEQVAVAGGCFADGDFPQPTQQVYEHHRKAWLILHTQEQRT